MRVYVKINLWTNTCAQLELDRLHFDRKGRGLGSHPNLFSVPLGSWLGRHLGQQGVPRPHSPCIWLSFLFNSIQFNSIRYRDCSVVKLVKSTGVYMYKYPNCLLYKFTVMNNELEWRSISEATLRFSDFYASITLQA